MNYATYEEAKAAGGSKFLAFIFGYVALGLLITAGMSALASYLFTSVWPIMANPELYLGVIIGAAVLQIVLILWITFGVLRHGGNMAIPFLLYSLCMGVLLSALTLTIDPYILGETFGITCLVFLIMALVGYFSKANLSSLIFVGMGLLLGSIALSLFNIFIGSDTIGWIVTFAAFGAIMLITAFDMWRIKKIIEQGAMSNNLAMYCAFSLYVDFVYMFIRIAIILSRIRR